MGPSRPTERTTGPAAAGTPSTSAPLRSRRTRTLPAHIAALHGRSSAVGPFQPPPSLGPTGFSRHRTTSALNRPGAAACLTIVRQAVHALRKANAPKAAGRAEEPSGGAGGVRAIVALTTASTDNRSAGATARMPARAPPALLSSGYSEHSQWGTRSTHGDWLGPQRACLPGHRRRWCAALVSLIRRSERILEAPLCDSGHRAQDRLHSTVAEAGESAPWTLQWPPSAATPAGRPWCSPRREGRA
jgi:hypothetical protein